MGNIFGWLIGGNNGRTDDPDPVTKLTSRDVYLIQNSWIPIRKQLTKVGVDLLLALFEKYPKEKEFFPFRNVPNDQLANDKKFHAHCNRVMHNVDAIVENIANVDLLIEILNKIGETHRKHKLTPQSFWRFYKINNRMQAHNSRNYNIVVFFQTMFTVVIATRSSQFKSMHVKDVMVDMFKKIMNKETLDAWDRALDVAFGVVNKNLE